MSTFTVMVLGLSKMWLLWAGLILTFVSLGIMEIQEKKHKRHQMKLRNRKEYYSPQCK